MLKVAFGFSGDIVVRRRVGRAASELGPPGKLHRSILLTAIFCVAMAPFDRGWADTTLPSTSPVAAVSTTAVISLSPDDRDALARVTYAEAGDQGSQGIAAVVFTILNRASSGKFQNSVQAVISAPYQFEPVARVGGWRNLPALSRRREVEFDRILAAIQSGQLADPTGGALYFQNRAIVVARAAAGIVPAALIDFGGQPAIARIGDHSFYRDVRFGGAWPRSGARRMDVASSGWGMVLGTFAQEFRALRAIELVKLARGLSENVGQPSAVLLKDGKFYSAVLAGLPEETAATTCAFLRRAGAYCVKVTPAQLADPNADWRN